MTTIINLFGSPGAGKSTTRAGLFHHLKLRGMNVEEVTEFAKDLTWENRAFTLTCQPYVFSKQLRNMERLMDKVDLIITDSPILLSYFYGKKCAPDRYPESFYNYVVDQFFCLGDQFNYYLNRVKDYNPAGRNQTEAESDEIDKEQFRMLMDLKVPITIMDGNADAVKNIAADIMIHHI